MTADEIIEEMRRNDRLLRESEVVLAVQQELMKMGYEPFEERVMGMYKAIDNVSEVCIMEEYDSLYEKANNGGWITNRVPTKEECKNKRFWITDSDGWTYEGDFNTEFGRWIDVETGGFIHVLAWQPLPEPYKGE